MKVRRSGFPLIFIALLSLLLHYSCTEKERELTVIGVNNGAPGISVEPNPFTDVLIVTISKGSPGFYVIRILGQDGSTERTFNPYFAQIPNDITLNLLGFDAGKFRLIVEGPHVHYEVVIRKLA